MALLYDCFVFGHPRGSKTFSDTVNFDLPSTHGQNVQVHTVIFGKKACDFLVS